MSPGSLIPSSGRVHKAKSQTQLWRRYKAEGRSAPRGAGSVCQLIGGVWASWRHWSLSEAPTSAGSPEAAHGSSQGQGGTGWLQIPPPPHGRCAKWEIKELPRAPRGLADPAPQEGVGGREPEGRALPRAPAALPESECLVCCSLTLKLNRSPTTFNTPPDSRKPKDFSLEWEPETFQISLRFREIKLPLSPWMPSMARGHSQSPFSSVPD